MSIHDVYQILYTYPTNPMQLTTHKRNIVEKILRDQGGRLVRATFCVYEQAGRIKARLVSITPIDEGVIPNKKSIALAGFSQTHTYPVIVQSRPVTPSPYFNTNTLYFSGSKPRAPTF